MKRISEIVISILLISIIGIGIVSASENTSVAVNVTKDTKDINSLDIVTKSKDLSSTNSSNNSDTSYNNTGSTVADIVKSEDIGNGKAINTVVFPSYYDKYSVQNYPYWNYYGDKVTGKRTLSLSYIDRIDMDLRIDNGLSESHDSLDFRLYVNGIQVGSNNCWQGYGDCSFFIQPWDGNQIKWTFFLSSPIYGPVYNIKLETDGNGGEGYGSIIIPPGQSTFKFYGSSEPGGNLLKNPGFEKASGKVPQYWNKYQTGNKAIFTYPEPGRAGGKSIAIKYMSKEIDKVALWQQRDIYVTPNSQYKLSGYIKLQGVTGGLGVCADYGPCPRYNGAGLRINWLRSDGKLIKVDVMTVSGTKTWTKYQKIFTAPDNAAKASVGVDLYNAKGKAWFDDISLVKVS